jgi:hypothetical protein
VAPLVLVTVIVADCDTPDARLLKPIYVNDAFASDKVTCTSYDVELPTVKLESPGSVDTLTPLSNTFDVF